MRLNTKVDWRNLIAILALSSAALTGCAQTATTNSATPEATNLPYPSYMKVPAYPGSAVRIASEQKFNLPGDSDSGICTVMLATPDAPDKVYAYYKTELTNKGWQVKTQSNGTLNATRPGTNGEDNIAITASVNAGETMVGLVQNR